MEQMQTVNALAQNPHVEDDSCYQYLTFFLQDEMFGINIAPIKEITEYGKLTPIPMVPDYVRGVINIRGHVVPVIDLPVRFGWESSPLNKRTCIVILDLPAEDGRSLELGIVIDSVSEVLDIAPQDIGQRPKFGTSIRTDFIEGMGKIGEEFIVLLNVEKVLTDDDMAALKQVSEMHND